MRKDDSASTFALEYESPTAVQRGRFRPLLLILSIFVPTISQALLITLAEWRPVKTYACRHADGYGWLALGLSIVAGCVLLKRSGLSWQLFIWAAISFAILQIGWLIVFTIEFC